jgi:hypothetical protein
MGILSLANFIFLDGWFFGRDFTEDFIKGRSSVHVANIVPMT